MRYELINYTLGAEPQIVKTEINNGIAEDVITDEYSVVIKMEIKDTTSLADNFFKEIFVTSHNNQTGFEVDAQRQLEVENYIKSINK